MKSNYATKRTLLVLVITGILTLSHFNPLTLFAAPAKGGAEAVAEGYPAWTGLTAKNYVCGRVIPSASDLRQRTTIVVEIDANKAREQMELTGDLSRRNFSPQTREGSNWEGFEIPHGPLVIYVVYNLKDREAFKTAIKPKDNITDPGLWQVRCYTPPVYERVTFDGAPENGGKFPFVYVMGYEGKEALVKETYAKGKTPGAISKAIAAQNKLLTEKSLTWRKFYGYVAEPKHFKDIEKSLAKGKPPLDAVSEKIKKGIKSNDPEVAKEAQMLYDALEQTRDDYIYQATCEAGAAPHVAAYHMNLVLKYWPKTKKQFESVQAKLKAHKDAKPLITIYSKLAQWSDPNFFCKNDAEAKKIVAELNKYKKMLEPLKNDPKNLSAQNGALVLDGMLDELITVIPAKVQSK